MNCPEEELNEMEASNLSETEFRVMIIRIFNSVKKDTETTKKGPVRNKEFNNTLEGINSRLN